MGAADMEITLVTENSKVRYVGDGIRVEFTYDFNPIDLNYVKVYKNLVEVNSPDITVSPGVVTFEVAPLAGDSIVIMRDMPLTYEKGIVSKGIINSDSLDNLAVELLGQIQQVNEKLSRTPTYPIDTPLTGDEIYGDFNQDVQEIKSIKTKVDDKAEEIDVSVSTGLAEINELTSESQVAITTSKNEAIENINSIAGEAIQRAETAATSAETSSNEAEEWANKAEAAASDTANYASHGNVGDIQYTLRTEPPTGSVWCDGAEYTKESYPDLYQMLVDGNISSTDYSTFDSSVSTNGSCGLFALDAATTSFKVPLLSDVYIKAGQAPEMFVAESLPNITGSFQCKTQNVANGAFSDTKLGAGQAYWQGVDNDALYKVAFKASRSSSVYKDNAKVNPDHAVYRAYVVLFTKILDTPSSVDHASIWAEGSDESVELLGGEHSAKGWNNEVETLANSSITNITNKTDESLTSLEETTNHWLDEIRAAGIAGVFGNIGDIKYTTRTDVPNGGAWCDGAEYTQAAFPDIYQMLVGNKLQKTDYETFSSSVSTNGYCEFFALDTSAQKFKVPKLLDKYVMDLADDVPVVGNGLTLGLTNGTKDGGWGQDSSNDIAFYTGLLGKPTGSPRSGSAISQANVSFGITSDAEKSGIIADTSATGKLAKLKAYVILYTSAVEASVAQAQEFMTALGGKANIALENVNPAQSFIDTSVNWCMPDYSAGVSVTYPYTAPSDGVIITSPQFRGGETTVMYIDDVQIFYMYGANISYDSKHIVLPVNKGNKITLSRAYAAGGDKFYPMKGVV